MLTHNAYLAARRYPALDGLRAVAAVMVVVFHYGGPSWESVNGWIGVQMFFVLSGYLITTLALREEERDGRISLADFYIRRVFRIMPVYYTVLAMVVVLTYLRGQYRGSGLPDALPFFLTFTNDYHVIGTFGQAWTLAVEQKFYLVWPLLAFGIALPFLRRLSLGFGLFILGIVLIPVVPYSSAYGTILLGCTLAIAMHDMRGFTILRPLTHPVSGVIMLTGVLLVQTNYGEIREAVSDTFAGTTYGVLVALLIPALVSKGPVSWVLALPPLRWIGERSYGLYLVQGIAGFAVAGTFTATLSTHRTLTAIAVTLVGLILADFLHRWVEQPMIKAGRTLVTLRRAHTKPRKRTNTNKPEQLVKTS